MNTARPTSAATLAAVTERWRAGDRFGVLCTGDALAAETLFRALAPDADHVFGHAEAVTPETLAPLGGDRVLALAWDVGETDAALLRRCTAVLACGDPADLPLAAEEETPGGAVPRDRAGADPRPAEAEQEAVVAAVVRMLHAAGVHDHGVDLRAARLALGLHAAGHVDALSIVCEAVADPRRRPRHPDDEPAGGFSDTDADAGPDIADADDEQAGQDTGAPGGPEDESEKPGESTVDGPTPPGGDDRDERGKDDADRGSADTAPEASPGEEDGRAGRREANEDDGTGEDAAGEAGQPTDASSPAPAERALDASSGSTAAGGPIPSTRSPASDAGGDDGRSDGQGSAEGDGPSLAPVPGARSRRDVPVDPERRLRGSASRHLRGRRGAMSSGATHGAAARVVPIERAGGRIALFPTLQRAARRRAAQGETAPVLVRSDLRGVIRRRRGGSHTVIVVDGSSSLGSAGIAEAGTVTDEVVARIASRRGVVSLVVAAGPFSRTVIERSTSLARTRQALAAVRSGGGTPLADAVRRARLLLGEDERPRRRTVLLTDGRPTVGLDGRHLTATRATAELEEELRELSREVPDIVLVPLGIRAAHRRAEELAPFRAVGVRVLGVSR